MENIDKIIVEIIKNYEEELKRNYKKALTKIEAKLRNLYHKLGDNITIADMAKYNRLSIFEKKIIEEIKELLNSNINVTEKGLKDVFQESYYRMFHFLWVMVGASVGFALLTEQEKKAAINNEFVWPKRMKGNAQLYFKQLKDVLLSGFKRGDSYIKMSKEFSRITELDYKRSLRIIRTEGHRVQILGKLNSLDKFDKSSQNLGLKSKRVWVATLDERTRSSHAEMDAKEAQKIDGKLMFTLPSGVHTAGPGLSGIAEEDINCRCTLKAVIEGYEREQKYKNYKEWLKEKKA